MGTVTQNFSGSGNWVCPAGVFKVNVQTLRESADVEGLSSAQSNLYFKDPDGLIYGMGGNAVGQLGDGTVAAKSSPVAVQGNLQFKKINSDGLMVLGLTQSTGQLFVWGLNSSGALGDGTNTAKSSPVAVAGALTFKDFHYTNSTAAAITKNGKLFTWGANNSGQLGDGTIVNKSSPIAVAGTLTFKQAIVSNQAAVFAVGIDGLGWAWGLNSSGQLGLGTIGSVSSPTAIAGGITFTKIKPEFSPNTLDVFSTLGLATDGKLWGWGGNANGTLGDGTTVAKSSPVAVLGNLTFVDFIIVRSSVLALTTTGKIYGWGANTSGQLGLGDILPRSSPVAVLGNLIIQSIMTDPGAVFTPASAVSFKVIDSTGTCYNIGVASGTTGLHSSPTAIFGNLKIRKVVQGVGETLLVTQTGQVYTFGINNLGCLGLGDTGSHASPTAVLGSFGADPQTFITQRSIVVVPGTTYVYSTDYSPCFAGYGLGKDAVNLISISYEQ